MGFHYEPLLSEIELTTDSSHSTCSHQIHTIFPIKIEQVLHEEDFVQHVLFDTGRRRTRLGIGKKEDKQNQVKITPSSCAKDLTISEGTGVEFYFFSIPIQEFLCVSTPFFETSKKWTNSFSLGTHTRNRDNGNLTINDFIFIYEFHSNRNTCTEFRTCYSLSLVGKDGPL